ncbi:DUF4870 domain-containing protein [Pontiellaceae bacterium B12219]|nr:DUF4870 domain-containing protein [Pontiellaceae bacterium B12219]
MENDEMKSAEGIIEKTTPAPLGKNERQWGMACHLSALIGYLLPVPSANFIGPLVIWLMKREEGAFVDEQGRESLNFQLSILIYVIGCGILMLIGIGMLLIFPLVVFGFVCPIIGAIKASNGIAYRYPLCIRFIK